MILEAGASKLVRIIEDLRNNGMKALWAAAIALAGATSASATVYTYEYQGLPVLCGGPEGLVPEHGCGLLDSPEGWSGAIGIDETMLPGGTLANANIRITAGEAHPISGYGSSRVSGYHVEQGNRIFEGRGLDGFGGRWLRDNSRRLLRRPR